MVRARAFAADVQRDVEVRGLLPVAQQHRVLAPVAWPKAHKCKRGSLEGFRDGLGDFAGLVVPEPSAGDSKRALILTHSDPAIDATITHI